MGTDGQTKAREYLRVSKDKSGRQRSVTEQQDDGRAAWPDWHFLPAYTDESISASRYSTKVRGGYDQLIADLEHGRFRADVLVLWESSRGSRRVAEWAHLIDLCESKGVHIAVTSHGRTYDPANGRDRRTLQEDAIDSEYESAKISARARRAQAANAAAGKPHGRTPYGYRRRYDAQNRRLIAQEPDPIEAPIVRELFDRLARGHSLRSISADLEARGVRTRSGRVFSPQHLRDMALKHTYAGKRIHAPGRDGKLRKGQEYTVVDGQWEPLVPEALWLNVNRILTDPKRRTTRPGRARHLLSMIGTCGVCGGPLAAKLTRPTRDYVCHQAGHVRITADDLDEYAEAVIIGYLQRSDNLERLTANTGDDAALDEARLEVARCRAELDDLADEVGSGALSAALAARAEPAIRSRLNAAQAELNRLETPPVLRGLITPGADVARRWQAAPMSTKRQIARLLLSPDIIGTLVVDRGGRAPVEERTRFERG